MKKIAIVGFGRFGKILYRLLQNDFQIIIGDRHNIAKIYQANVIFYCVPIAAFEKVISDHKKYFKNHLLIDVLSVKIHPAKVFKKYLKGTNSQAILTHPMFGPDSTKHGFNGLTIMMNKFISDNKKYEFWKGFFLKKGLKVMEMSAKKHDELTAKSQAVTHFIGRLLSDFKFVPTSIDTLGTKKLHEVINQTCNDSWQLFTDLQKFNPNTKKMRLQLIKSFKKINKLL